MQERSDVPYGHASMLLLGKGSEATEPYNKYDKIRPHSIRSLQSIKRFDLCPFDQKNSTYLQPPGVTVVKELGAGTFRHQPFGRQKFLPISATIMSLKCPVQYVHIPPSALNAGAKRSEAERRAIWPCLNVATWRRKRSDRAIQQIC